MQSALRTPHSALHWVFIHGAAGSSAFWTGQAASFPGARFLDLPGHAPTPRTHGTPPAAPSPRLPTISVATYAAWVAGQLDALGGRAVVLVGHSLGGAVALELALGRPAWLCGLVLASTGARLRVAPALLDLLAADYAAAIDWIVAHSFGPGATRYQREGARRQMLRADPAVTLADFLACDAFDARPALAAASVTVPTLVIYGNADAMTPPKYSEFLAQAIPTSTLVALPALGHHAPAESPAAWSAAVHAWADTILGDEE